MAETLRRPRRPISEGVGVAYRQHRVLVGINYPPEESRRREPGEIVTDIPPWMAEVLMADGSIERVKDAPDHEVPEAEEEPPPLPVAVELEGTPELVLLPEDGEG